MKYIIYLMLVLLSACTFEKGPRTEGGVVVSQNFIPYRSDIGTGMSSSGSMVITSSSDPEHWITVFKCDHGHVFPIDRKELFLKLKAGDSVQIEYREICKESDSAVIDFNFLDANVIK